MPYTSGLFTRAEAVLVPFRGDVPIDSEPEARIGKVLRNFAECNFCRRFRNQIPLAIVGKTGAVSGAVYGSDRVLLFRRNQQNGIDIEEAEYYGHK